MEKYFILRAKEWHMCYIRGTMEELERFLCSVGAEMTKSEDIDYFDFGLVYRKRICTKINAIGYDKEKAESAFEQIKNTLSEGDARELSIHLNELELAVHKIYSNMPIKSDRFDILVSEGEKRTIPNHHFIGGRTFHKFSDIDVKDFWRFMREFAYVSNV